MPNDQPSTISTLDDEDDKVFRDLMAENDRWLHHDWPENKVGREMYVVGAGTADAVGTAFSHKNIGQTALGAAGSVAVGFAVRAAEAEIPALRPAIAIGFAALAFSSVRDLLGKAANVRDVLVDTWHNQDNRELDRSKFAEHGGKFLVDLALTTGGGLAGSELGDRALFGPTSNFRRIATYDGIGLRGSKAVPHDRLYRRDDPLALLYDQTKASNVRFHGEILKGRGSGPYAANGFILTEDGLAATNWHCASNKDVITMRDHLGVTHKGTVLADDYASDVAIVQLQKGMTDTVFEPVKLAKTDPKAGDKVFLIGHQSNMTERTIHPGVIKDVHQLTLRPDPTPEAVAERRGVTLKPLTRKLVYTKPVDMSGSVVHNDYFMANYFSKHGYSGSPVVNEAGEVVGLHFGTFGHRFTQLTSRVSAVPVSAITRVLEEALVKRSQ